MQTESRALDRVIAFTDGAVAIALTLLVLPLVDVARDASETPVTTLLGDHSSDFLAFVISFFVVMAFWRGHRRQFEPLVRLDERLVTLNTLWLLGVVFVPVPTAVLTFQGDGQSIAALLYLANLLFVGLMGLGLSIWVHRNPSLLRTPDLNAVRRGIHRSLTMCLVLLVVMLLAIPLGTGALLLLIVALPVGQALSRRIRRRREERAAQA